MRTGLEATVLLLILASTALAAPPPAAGGPDTAPATLPPPAAPATACCDNGDAPSCHFFARAEYLLWWIKSAPLGPPLLTGDRNNDPFSHIDTAGGLTDPNTVVLLGNSRSDYDPFSGVRLTTGWWFAEGLGVEASGFVLERQTNISSVSSDSHGNPFLFRPIFNTDTGNPNSGEVVAAEDNFSGTVTVSTDSRLWGAETNLAVCWLHTPRLSVDALVGFRYLQLEENLRIFSSSTIILPFGPSFGIPFNGGTLSGVGDSVLTAERFATQSQFYGAQVGVRADAHWRRLDVATTVKVGLGVAHQIIDITGNTTGVTAAGQTTVSGGILAVASNIGHFNRDDFAVVPELNFQLGFLITPALRTFVGYDFLYCSSVVRPGDQISLQVNDTQVPQSPAFGLPPAGPLAPLPPSKTADFWAQGFNFGVELRF